jgi:hypothetical protein
LTAAAVNSTEPAQEKGDRDRRDKHEMEQESEGQPEDEDEEEDKEEDEDPADAEGEQPRKTMRMCLTVVSEESVQDGKEDGKRAANNEAAHASKKSKPSPFQQTSRCLLPNSNLLAPKFKPKSVRFRSIGSKAKSRRRSKVEE